jgi:hypothetical protein
VNSVTSRVVPSSTIAAWNATTALLISVNRSFCRASWSSPWVSKPPMLQKKHCRGTPSAPRAAISNAIMRSCWPSEVPGNTVVSAVPLNAVLSTRCTSIERPITLSHVCRIGSEWLSPSSDVIAVDIGSVPPGV